MRKGIFQPDESEIKEHSVKAIYEIEEEMGRFGTFEEQYAALEGFRKELIKYVCWASPNRKLFRNKVTLVGSGDVLDWHVTGYFAPMDFKRSSWGGKTITIRAYHRVK